jgi:ABC-2 type transport system permease protein
LLYRDIFIHANQTFPLFLNFTNTPKMLLNITLFELRYGFRRAQTYVFFTILFLLTFLFMTTDAVSIGGATGNINKNAPFVINQTVMIMTLIGMTMTSGIVGGAILRDFEFKAHELFFTTPMTKLQYVMGRFLGAYLVSLFVYSGILFGIGVGTFMPWLDAEKIMPFRLDAYVQPFLAYIVPNVLFASAIFFMVGILTRNMLAVYVQGMVLLAAYSISRTLLADIQNDTITNFADPFGISATRLVTRYWTVIEQNSQVMPLVGDFLLNRFVWLGVGIILFLAGLSAFEFSAKPLQFFTRKPKSEKQVEVEQTSSLNLPSIQREETINARVKQFLAQVRFYTLTLIKGRPFQIIGMITMINLGFNAWFADSSFGTTVYPVTYIMIDQLQGGLFGFLIAVMSISVGELVWRERSININQTTDALDIPHGMTLASKICAVLISLMVLMLVIIVAGVMVQTMKSYTHYELGLYFNVMIVQSFPLVLQYTLLSFFVHAVVNNKFIGNIVAVLVFIAVPILQGGLRWDHNLYLFAGYPSQQYSDMNGFGHWIQPMVWFSGYWTAVALLLALVAYLFWVRGTASSWKERLMIAKERVNARFLGVFGGTTVVAFALGDLFFTTRTF